MRKPFMLLLILLLTAFTPLDYAWADDAPQAEASSASASVPASVQPRGTLYRVQYQGHTAYLFGTIHVGKPEFYPLEPQVLQGLKEAEVLAVEFDISDGEPVQKAVFKYALYPNAGTIDQHVAPKTLARTKKALEGLGLPYDGVSHMKPWMIADEILILSLQKQGYPSELATDIFLINTAKSDKKPIVSLESADFQLGIFDKLTPKQQEAYLNDSLDDLESGEVASKNQDLLTAWAHADQKAFDALLAEARDDKTVSGRFFYRNLLLARNPAMADKIAQLIKAHEHSFVGIGLLHLVGQEGVPQLLQKKGFTVERLY